MELFIVVLLPALALLAAVTWVFWQVFRGIGFLLMKVFSALGLVFKRVFHFVRSEVLETLQFAGAVLSMGFLLPFTAANFLTGRWPRARHYANSIEDEFVSALTGLYRIGLAHPLRFLGLGVVLEGVERRLPSITEPAPKKMRNMAEAMEFEGYDVTGTLKAGGSGAQLYTARPSQGTLDRFKARGREMSDEVVIKSFALVNGSTLPQIIRESRALEAANRLGLVYEHDLDEDRFFYVMPYVKGDGLDVMIERMHARSGSDGLDHRQLALALGYARDLLRSLDRFHEGGLWHKDVKPSNLIISGERAHLVDFGLVTPLHSALTLTTHGTEYYRDPEMVRLAMQGVKVHEVDGVKFDLYSAGAVLFSMIENSFPAHGSLSQLSKTCPEALAWIIRRSMADIGSRYRGAWEMLDDLKTVAKARDPFLLRPADLPSMQRGQRGQHGQHGQTAERSDKDEQGANRFGMPSLRAKLASRMRPSTPVLDLGERPPRLPKLPKQQEARESRRGSGRGQRRSRGFAALMLGMLFFGAIASIKRSKQAEVGELQSLSRAEAEQTQQSAKKISHSSASPAQKQDFLEGQAILDIVRPTRASQGAELASLFSDSDSQGRGRGVYILQDYADPASDKIIADLKLELGQEDYVLVPNGEDQTRDAKLKFCIGDSAVGDPSALAELQFYLDTQEEIAAVIWICEGEKKDSAEAVLVLNQNLN